MRIHIDSGIYTFELGDYRFSCAGSTIFEAKTQFLKHIVEEIDQEIGNQVEEFQRIRRSLE